MSTTTKADRFLDDVHKKLGQYNACIDIIDHMPLDPILAQPKEAFEAFLTNIETLEAKDKKLLKPAADMFDLLKIDKTQNSLAFNMTLAVCVMGITRGTNINKAKFKARSKTLNVDVMISFIDLLEQLGVRAKPVKNVLNTPTIARIMAANTALCCMLANKIDKKPVPGPVPPAAQFNGFPALLKHDETGNALLKAWLKDFAYERTKQLGGGIRNDANTEKFSEIARGGGADLDDATRKTCFEMMQNWIYSVDPDAPMPYLDSVYAAQAEKETESDADSDSGGGKKTKKEGGFQIDARK